MASVWLQLKQQLGFSDTERPGEDRSEDALELAVAALMIEICESDFATDESEIDAVRQALRDTFGLSRAALDILVKKARTSHDQSVSLHSQVATINDLCSPDEKTRLVEQLWRVAFADGRLDKYEEYYLRKLCDLIYVPHRTFLQAKFKVAQELGIN